MKLDHSYEIIVGLDVWFEVIIGLDVCFDAIIAKHGATHDNVDLFIADLLDLYGVTEVCHNHGNWLRFHADHHGPETLMYVEQIKREIIKLTENYSK